MARPFSAVPAKPKQKGARSISTLTPSQLTRKRANDREARRAIRARTKRHIERLDRELAELKTMQRSDQTVQELLRRHRALKEERIQLKKNMGAPMSSPLDSAPGITPPLFPLADDLFSTSTVNENLDTNTHAITSPRGSSLPSNCNSHPDYSQQYVPLSNNCESWASTISCPVPSNVLGSLSSADYIAGYIPISVLSSILPSNINSSSISTVYSKDVIEMECNIAPQAPPTRMEDIAFIMPSDAAAGSLKLFAQVAESVYPARSCP